MLSIFFKEHFGAIRLWLFSVLWLIYRRRSPGNFSRNNYGLIEGGNAVNYFVCFFGRLTPVILCLLVDHRLKMPSISLKKLLAGLSLAILGQRKGEMLSIFSERFSECITPQNRRLPRSNTFRKSFGQKWTAFPPFLRPRIARLKPANNFFRDIEGIFHPVIHQKTQNNRSQTAKKPPKKIDSISPFY